MPEVKVLDDEHLCRLVKRAHQVVDVSGNPIGITWAAFDLRPMEKYLSVNCLERAGGDKLSALRAIRSVLSTKMGKISKCLLTIGKVGDIKGSFLPHKIRVTSEAKAADPYYAAVRQYPLDRQLALEKLAASAWCDWVKVDSL